MAKTKGSNPPYNAFSYRDADGTDHFLGEFLRSIFGEGSISRYDPTVDNMGISQRGLRPTQQGAGSADQEPYRDNFLNCVALWNSLPEECPDPLPEPHPTSKDSVWAAKQEHGVVCSYFDLFMRCCLKWAIAHNGEMPVGDCFPCIVECIEDPDMEFIEGETPQTITRDNSVTLTIAGNNSPFTWEVSGVGFSLEHSETEGLTNTLHADSTACGTASIFVVGCDDQSVSGYVTCTVGQWLYYGEVSVPKCPGNQACFPYCSVYVGSGTWTKGRFRMTHYSLFGSCDGGVSSISVSGALGVADAAYITGKGGPYYAHGRSYFDPVARFYYWGC